jgi:hypothetical protein
VAQIFVVILMVEERFGVFVLFGGPGPRQGKRSVVHRDKKLLRFDMKLI